MQKRFVQALLMALILAVAWWGLGYVVRLSTDIPVWGDQGWTFLDRKGLFVPYEVAGFVNPPWVHLILHPLKWWPIEWAVLAQMLIYFVALTALVFKYQWQTNRAHYATLVVLTSPFALDTAIEINIDWIVVLGLIVHPVLCAPLLMAKPQVAWGYIIGLRWSYLWRASVVGAITLIASFAVWGFWPPHLLENLERSPVSVGINVAPMNMLGVVPSLVIGVLLVLWALRRRDTWLGVLAGLFFVPYIAAYSAMIPYTLIAARHPRFAFVLSVALWLGVALVVHDF